MAYISEKILDIIKNGAKDTAFIVDAMLSTRPESYRKFRASFRGISIPDKRRSSLEIRKENQKIYNTLNHLRREGFIRKEDRIDKAGITWLLTKAGLQKLDRFRSLAINSKREITYTAGVSKNLVIVAFDVPEKLRRCREWLRDALKVLGFSMIQQSVWVGNCKIPEEFVLDLEKRGVAKCVDIFEVGKRGTLERLKF